MRPQINCDQVFDILTRGPFPSGDPRDSAVEMHLIACHECRRLAEALRPAVELFHEAVPSSEHHELPGYHGALCEPAVSRTSRLPMLATRSSQARATRRWHGLSPQDISLPRFAAALAMAAGLCGLLWGLGWTNPEAPRKTLSKSAAAPRPMATALVNSALAEVLGSFQLSAACLQRTESSPALVGPDPVLIRDSTLDQLCCTFCHAAKGSARVSPDALAAVARSCQACHPGRLAN